MKRRERRTAGLLVVAVLALSVGCSTWQQSVPPAPKTIGQGIVAVNAAIEGLARETSVLVQGGAISTEDGARVLQVLGAASMMVDQIRTDMVDPNSVVDPGVVFAQVEALIASARDMLVQAGRK